MPKDKVSEWSSTPSNNTDIGGINISEGCAPSGINNAIRELMAQVKDMQAGSDGDGLVVGGMFTSSGGAVISGAATFSNTVTISGATTFSNTVVLGGSATATTPSASDDSTKVATTAFVKDVALPDTSGNGIVARTGALTVTNRTITAGTGITITDGDGVAGNPTITNSSPSIGVSQTWQDVTSSRALGSTYTNSTGRPIMVVVTVRNANAATSSRISFTVGGVNIALVSPAESNGTSFNQLFIPTTFIVPDGSTYVATQALGTSAISSWVELR